MPREEIELAAVARTGVQRNQLRNHRAQVERVNQSTGSSWKEINSIFIVHFQKTTYLLVSVVVVFMCAWFPLNFLNVLLDLGFYKDLFR